MLSIFKREIIYFTPLSFYYFSTDVPAVDPESFKSKLLSKSFSFVVARDLPGQDGQKAFYYFAKLVSNVALYVELKFKAGVNACKVTVKSNVKSNAEYGKTAVVKLLS